DLVELARVRDLVVLRAVDRERRVLRARGLDELPLEEAEAGLERPAQPVALRRVLLGVRLDREPLRGVEEVERARSLPRVGVLGVLGEELLAVLRGGFELALRHLEAHQREARLGVVGGGLDARLAEMEGGVESAVARRLVVTVEEAREVLLEALGGVVA